jgi:hypothetical protein
MVMVEMRLRNLLASADLFRQACLWKWMVAGQPGISLTYFTSGNSIVNRIELNEAIVNFDLFQAATFGPCWSGCTAKFVQNLSVDPNLVILKTKYVQQEFEKSCCWMYTKLREEAEIGADMRWGDYWSELFTQKLEAHSLSFSGQLVWEHVILAQLSTVQSGSQNTVQSVPQSTVTPKATPMKASFSSADAKQVCYGFLRKALSVNGIDGNAPTGCTKTGCQRAHENVFTFSKAYVISQVNSGPMNQQDLVTAVSNSNRFNT